jgi:hypothetical protein
MHTPRRSLLFFGVAFAGLLLSAAPANAFWPKYSYRQRTVVRGWGGPAVIGAPGVFVGPTVGLHSGVGTQAFLLGSGGVGTQAFLLGSGVPTLRQSLLLGDSDTDLLTQAFLRQAFQLPGLTPQGFKQPSSPGSGSGTGTGTGTGTGGTTTTVCTGLSDRLDKIDGRLSKLETDLQAISDKVDGLIAEKIQQRMLEQQRQLIQEITKNTAAMITANNKTLVELTKTQNTNLATLFRELLKKPEDRDTKKMDDLLRQLEGK